MKHLDPAYDARGNKHVKAKRRAKILEISAQQPQVQHDEQIQNQEPLLQTPLDLSPNCQQRQPRVSVGHEALQARLSVGQSVANTSDLNIYSADSTHRYNGPESEEDYSNFDDSPQFDQDMDVDTSCAQPPAKSSINADANDVDSTSTPQSISTVTRAIATSATKIAALKMIQETTPRIQELTRLLESLQADSGSTGRSDNAHENLAQEEVDLVLKGMEAAALLERQLARMCSRNRPN